MKQLTLLTAKAPFAFRPEGKGRAVQVAQGERFEVMSSSASNTANGFAQIAREGKGKLGLGWAFSLAQLGDLFTVAE